MKIAEHLTYRVGPYKDYFGHAEYDHEADIFHGEIIGATAIITFQAAAANELLTAFRESVDDYLDFCAKRGESPSKPFSGDLLVRITPEVHWKLVNIACLQNKTIDQFVADRLTQIAHTETGE